ncbi:MAG: hypothetical protein GY745_21285 [Actinomycetia bacterium]|nr:hypothetical protein [Actinomycetes bacterium]
MNTGTYPWVYVASSGPYFIDHSAYECWVGEHAEVLADVEVDPSDLVSGTAPPCVETRGEFVPGEPLWTTSIPNSAAYKGDRLERGESLHPGEYIAPDNLRSVLFMQPDGNVVLIIEGKLVWETETNGLSADRLTFQGDGNLVVYDDHDPSDPTDDEDLWDPRDLHPTAFPAGGSAHAAATTTAELVIQNDGNVVAYNDAQHSSYWWHTHTHGKAEQPVNVGDANMYEGDRLQEWRYIHNLATSSPHALLMQTNGDVVLYGPGAIVEWHSDTDVPQGTPVVGELVVQYDGNVVIKHDGSPVAWTGTGGHPGALLRLGGDGNLVVYDSGVAEWNRNGDTLLP